MRVKPDFRVKRTTIHKPLDFISLLFISVIGYLIFSAIIRYTSGSGSSDDRVVCFGTLICLVVFYLQAKEQEKQGEQKRMELQKEWVRTSKSADVVIVDRRGYPGGTFEDGYYPGEYHHHSPSYVIQLEMTDDQRIIAPKQTVVSVSVDGNTYEKLEKRERVRIYYKPEKPFAFLLEEEL